MIIRSDGRVVYIMNRIDLKRGDNAMTLVEDVDRSSIDK